MRTTLVRSLLLSAAFVACGPARSFTGTDATSTDATGAMDHGAIDATSLDARDASIADAGRADSAVDAAVAADAPDSGPGCSGANSDPYPDLSMPGDYSDPADCTTPSCPGAFQNFAAMANADNTVAVVTGFSPHSLTCSFVVVSASCGVEQGTLGLDPDTGDFTGPVPLFCGQNLVKIICTNGTNHRIHVVDLPGRDCAGDDLRLTLTWDSNVIDGELHLIIAPSHINDPMNDCTWTTCIAPRVLDWGVVGDATDNPVKDVDNTSANGTEHITLTRAPAGTYYIMSEHWNPGGATGAMSMQINVQGRTPIRQDVAMIAEHWVWYVGTIQFPGGVFTPSDASAAGQTPPLTDCTAAWTFPGCDMPIPQ